MQAVRARFEPWVDDRLIVDAVEPPGVNMGRVLAYLSAGLPKPVDVLREPCYHRNHSGRFFLSDDETLNRACELFLYLCGAGAGAVVA